MGYAAFSVANQNQGTVVLNSTALNLNNRLFRASASFDNKIKTMNLICLAKSFIDTPTCSLCMILVYDFDTSILFTNCFGNYLSLSKARKRFVFAFSIVRTILSIQWTDTWKMRELHSETKGTLLLLKYWK